MVGQPLPSDNCTRKKGARVLGLQVVIVAPSGSGARRRKCPQSPAGFQEQVSTVSAEGTLCTLWVGSAHNRLGGWQGVWNVTLICSVCDVAVVGCVCVVHKGGISFLSSLKQRAFISSQFCRLEVRWGWLGSLLRVLQGQNQGVSGLGSSLEAPGKMCF